MINSPRINNAFVVALLVGNFAIIVIPGILKVPHFLFTVPLKWGILVYSLAIITSVLFVGKPLDIFKKAWPLILFLCVYCARVFFDLYFFDVKLGYYPYAMDYIENLVYCFIPSIALFFMKGIDVKWITKWCYILFLGSALISLFISLGSGVQEDTGRYQGTEGLTSIVYGHYGVTLAFLSVCLLSRRAKVINVLYLASFFLALFIIYLAGSRSPFVSLVICIFAYQVLRNGLSIGIFFIFLLILPIYFFFEDILNYLSQFGSAFVDRLLYAYQTGESGGRDRLVMNAFEAFLDNPLFGDAFLLQRGYGVGFYPHNLIIESLMATGIVGGFLFLKWVYSCMVEAYKIISTKSEATWIALLFIQYFVAGMFSFSLFSHEKFWNASVLVFFLSKMLIRDKREDIQ